MFEVRFHGRGGQGAKIASRILGSSGFLSGLYAQDFALFGAERRGAPVVSCTRLGSRPIETRGYIDMPDLVVAMDHTLLKEARAQVFHGVHSLTPFFINAADPAIAVQELPAANFRFIDLNGIGRRLTGRPLVSAAAAALAAKSIEAISLAALIDAARIEFDALGMTQELVETNEAVVREVYALAPRMALDSRGTGVKPIALAVESIPYLSATQFMTPAIQRRASAALRHTGSWRMERPEIELAKCKRCFLCYLYCPDAAIQLDSENYPHLDYDHCKGCMICLVECPTEAITRRAEE